ncbi:hypothetical protein [Paenibacillus thalictri]|uniref:Uncharacterized protein n=1 Tax=Paenibacillus thalictri TaxID=2527873 RepID=A0A4Q9DPU6_9BACL|nr:hypothetical protein [Paenibacillus thalictri]TBL76251.1 hypothetical protein EYB31_19805 [Paenibacillus thalictri]
MSGYIKKEQLHQELNNIIEGKQDNLNYIPENSENKGIAGGYAGLDTTAKIPTNQLPDSILGQVEYIGTWNATTNTPTLPSADIAKGQYYVVETEGIYQSIEFKVGDWIISNGSVWQKVDNTDAVPTVFGRTGNIVAAPGDYTATQVTFSPAPGMTATNVQAGIVEAFQLIALAKSYS